MRCTPRVASILLLTALAGCAADSSQKSDAEASDADTASDAQSGSSDASASEGGVASGDGGSAPTSDADAMSTDAARDGSAQVSQDAGSSSDASAGRISCDHRKALCRIAEPMCPANQVASVENGCFGPCVVIDKCSCAEAEECPHEEMYVCHRAAKRCGPYVN